MFGMESITTALEPRQRRGRLWLAGGAGLLAGLALALGVFSAPATTAGFAVGYVDTEGALKAHPGFAAAQTQVGQYASAREAELSKFQGRTLTTEEKRELLVLNEQIKLDIALKEQELMAPLAVDLENAISAVGQESGQEVILEQAVVLYGALDLTPAVIQKLKAP